MAIEGLKEAIRLMKEVNVYSKKMYNKIKEVCPRFINILPYHTIQLTEMSDEEMTELGMEYECSNEWDHFRTKIDGVDIVYLKDRPEEEDNCE